MAKKKQPKVIEFRTEKMATGETVVVAVYEAAGEPEQQKVKCRGQQTKDFNLMGGWQRDPFRSAQND